MNSNTLTSEEISEFNRNRSEIIFDKIYYKYFPLLRYFSLRITGYKEDARDIAIESLVKLWESKRGFANEAEIRMFLFVIAKNAAINIVEKNKLHKRLLSRWYNRRRNNEIVVTEADEETQIIERIVEMIERMPEQTRKVFKLCFFEELKNWEVANQLNTTANAVAQQKKKALEIIRKYFNRN